MAERKKKEGFACIISFWKTTCTSSGTDSLWLEVQLGIVWLFFRNQFPLHDTLDHNAFIGIVHKIRCGKNMNTLTQKKTQSVWNEFSLGLTTTLWVHINEAPGLMRSDRNSCNFIELRVPQKQISVEQIKWQVNRVQTGSLFLLSLHQFSFFLHVLSLFGSHGLLMRRHISISGESSHLRLESLTRS